VSDRGLAPLQFHFPQQQVIHPIVATLAMVPTLILFLFIQKFMVSGANAGAVKG
jgi:ABC-type maltose transport system permease subunit